MYAYTWRMWHNTTATCRKRTIILKKSSIMKRRDLAKMYFPDKQPREAVRSLLGWIKNCPDLMAALNALNTPYIHKQEFTARQVRLIMEYLGDP